MLPDLINKVKEIYVHYRIMLKLLSASGAARRLEHGGTGGHKPFPTGTTNFLPSVVC